MFLNHIYIRYVLTHPNPNTRHLPSVVYVFIPPSIVIIRLAVKHTRTFHVLIKSDSRHNHNRCQRPFARLPLASSLSARPTRLPMFTISRAAIPHAYSDRLSLCQYSNHPHSSAESKQQKNDPSAVKWSRSLIEQFLKGLKKES